MGGPHLEDRCCPQFAWAHTAACRGLSDSKPAFSVTSSKVPSPLFFRRDMGKLPPLRIQAPRGKIVDFYTNTFAPRVAGPLLDNLRTRLIEALVREASPQTSVR